MGRLYFQAFFAVRLGLEKEMCTELMCITFRHGHKSSELHSSLLPHLRTGLFQDYLEFVKWQSHKIEALVLLRHNLQESNSREPPNQEYLH